MRRYNYFHALFLSFFSRSFYQDVGRQWRGTGLLYLLIAIGLGYLFFAVKANADAEEVAPPYQAPPPYAGPVG